VDDCLFCSIAREGAYVHKANGFVAINDINPQAPVHVLVLPERHVDTFREIGEFGAKETKRMLEFVAETAAKVGLTDYRVLVNVGAAAGQTVSPSLAHPRWRPRRARRGAGSGRARRAGAGGARAVTATPQAKP